MKTELSLWEPMGCMHSTSNGKSTVAYNLRNHGAINKTFNASLRKVAGGQLSSPPSNTSRPVEGIVADSRDLCTEHQHTDTLTVISRRVTAFF